MSAVPIASVDIARFKRALTNLRRAQTDLEYLASVYTSISTDEADKHATLAKSHLSRAVEFADEAKWLAETEGASAFAA